MYIKKLFQLFLSISNIDLFVNKTELNHLPASGSFSFGVDFLLKNAGIWTWLFIDFKLSNKEGFFSASAFVSSSAAPSSFLASCSSAAGFSSSVSFFSPSSASFGSPSFSSSPEEKRSFLYIRNYILFIYQNWKWWLRIRNKIDFVCLLSFQ